VPFLLPRSDTSSPDGLRSSRQCRADTNALSIARSQSGADPTTNPVFAGCSGCSVPASYSSSDVTTSGPWNVPPCSPSGTVRVAPERGGGDIRGLLIEHSRALPDNRVSDPLRELVGRLEMPIAATGPVSIPCSKTRQDAV